MTVRAIALVMLGCVWLAGCGGKEEAPKDAVARAGDRSIDLTELNRSYALQPRWKRGETQLQSHLTQLHELVIQKLYAQEAERLGLGKDSLMREHLEFVRQKELIKGLYRRQVREKVQFDEAEERRTYAWMKKTVDFEYVQGRDSAACAVYARQLAVKDAAQLRLPADSSVRAGKQEEVQVGSVAPEVEPWVFDGKLRQVSPVIRAGNTFVALKVTGGTAEKFLSEEEFQQQREKVRKLLGNRKMDALASAYVASIMRNKDLKLNGPVFWAVADHFARRVTESRVDPMKIQSIYVTSDELHLLSVDLDAMGDAVVATHRGGVLKVRELLRALSSMPGSLRPRVRTPQNLKEAIGGIVRNQYLLQEAERQGLGSDPEVLRETALQRDEALAMAYYGRRRGEIQVTPGEVEAFKKRSPVSEEQVFFKFNMASLARDAKADSLLLAELPGLKARYGVSLDTVKVRSMLQAPDAVITENPVRIFVREIFM